MTTAGPKTRILKPLELPRRMAPTDALFWYAETALPIFRPIIGGLYVLDSRLDPEKIQAGYETALAIVPRLRQRVVEAPGNLGLPEWIDDSHFDRDYHLRHISLPEPGTMRQLLDVTAAVLATPLDRERPLWESYWIDGLEGRRSAYFFKLHHSVVDGVGSIALLNSLTQTERDGKLPRIRSPRHRPAAPSTSRPRELAKLLRDNALESARLAWRTASLPAGWIGDPAGAWSQLQSTARGLRGILNDLSSPVLQDPLACPGSGLSRRLDVMEVSLDRLRRIKEPLGVTINDVVLAALAGSIGAYHRQRHVFIDALNCMVPMNLRAKDDRDVLGNRVGTLNIVLPVGERRPELRLRRIVEQTTAAKSDKRAAAYPFLMQTLSFIPGAAFRWIARNSLGRVNLACTNVPGVPDRRYMAGAAVEAIYPFASVVEGTPLVMALFSYAGTMNVGIDTDPEAIPDPHWIAELFSSSLDELEELAAGLGSGSKGAEKPPGSDSLT